MVEKIGLTESEESRTGCVVRARWGPTSLDWLWLFDGLGYDELGLVGVVSVGKKLREEIKCNSARCPWLKILYRRLLTRRMGN